MADEAYSFIQEHNLLLAPAIAATAGGVAVSCLEMAQNRMLLNWTAPEVDERLRRIMTGIHQQCLEAAEEMGEPENYLLGANMAAFQRVVGAMQDQGVI